MTSMKNYIFVIVLLSATWLLAACSDDEETYFADVALTKEEASNVEAAKADLNEAAFEQAVQQTDEFVEETTYEAYILVRARLTEAHFEQAQAQRIFAADITYDDYEALAEEVVNRADYEAMLFQEEQQVVNIAYGAYAANIVQYVTPLLYDDE